MSSVKCPNCGFIDFPDATTCKRCGTSMLNLSQPKPPVMTWFNAYCVFMALLYLFCFVLGIVFLVLAPTDRDMSAEESRVMGVVFMVMGLVLAAPFAAGPFLPRKPWAWVFGLVLICIGLTSICCLPATVPLLIHWIKRETKLYFGRT